MKNATMPIAKPFMNDVATATPQPAQNVPVPKISARASEVVGSGSGSAMRPRVPTPRAYLVRIASESRPILAAEADKYVPWLIGCVALPPDQYEQRPVFPLWAGAVRPTAPWPAELCVIGGSARRVSADGGDT